MDLVCTILQLWIFAIFGRVILSWFPMQPGTVMAQIYDVLHTITEPVLGPVRRVMPPMGVGGMGLDLSPIIVLIGAQILIASIC